jgi:hypothetical protein
MSNDWSRRRTLAVAGAALFAGCGGSSPSDGSTGTGDATADPTARTSTGTPTPEPTPVPEPDASFTPSEWSAPTEAPTSDIERTVLVERLEIPWDIGVAGNGDLFVTERVGRVNRFSDGDLDAVFAPEDAIDAGSVSPGPKERQWWVKGGEGGALGVAIHPDYPDVEVLYVYYTASVDGGKRNCVSRFDLSADDPAATERVVIGDIPANKYHNGGRITFGPRGALWVTTGDAGDGALAADPGALPGSVLRVTANGDPVPSLTELRFRSAEPVQPGLPARDARRVALPRRPRVPKRRGVVAVGGGLPGFPPGARLPAVARGVDDAAEVNTARSAVVGRRAVATARKVVRPPALPVGALGDPTALSGLLVSAHERHVGTSGVFGEQFHARAIDVERGRLADHLTLASVGAEAPDADRLGDTVQVRAGDVALGGEHDAVEQREAHIDPELAPEVARPTEIRFVLDGDQFADPVVGVARRLAEVSRPAAPLLGEEAAVDGGVGDAAGAVGMGVDGLGDGHRLADARVALDGLRGNRSVGDPGAVVERRAGDEPDHVDDAAPRGGDGPAELAREHPVGRAFEVGTQRQLEAELHTGARDRTGKSARTLGGGARSRSAPPAPRRDRLLSAVIPATTGFCVARPPDFHGQTTIHRGRGRRRPRGTGRLRNRVGDGPAAVGPRGPTE